MVCGPTVYVCQTTKEHSLSNYRRLDTPVIWLGVISWQGAKIFTTQADPHNTSITKQQQEVLAALPDKLSFNHWVGEQVGEWIHSQPIDTPFLAVAGFSVGDTLGAEPHPESDSEGLIVQSLRQADAAIGRLLEQLAASNRAKDTVVIVTSARGNVDTTSRDKATPGLRGIYYGYSANCAGIG